jgi:hypothetical protein
MGNGNGRPRLFQLLGNGRVVEFTNKADILGVMSCTLLLLFEGWLAK